MIVGNKKDLAVESRLVTQKEAQNLNKNWPNCTFYEIQAKNYFDVQNVLHKCLQTIDEFTEKNKRLKIEYAVNKKCCIM